MSKSKKYRIKQKDFRKLEKFAEWIYNTVVVIDYFFKIVGIACLNKNV